jgi:hypothetical protein
MGQTFPCSVHIRNTHLLPLSVSFAREYVIRKYSSDIQSLSKSTKTFTAKNELEIPIRKYTANYLNTKLSHLILVCVYIYIYIYKVNVTPGHVYAGKERAEVQLQPIRNFGARTGWWSASYSGRFTPRNINILVH